MPAQSDPSSRRPLASRDTGWAKAVTPLLLRMGLTPNAISMLSVVAAAGACAAFVWGGASVSGLILAALCCQLRLLCNLFDGLVAVEGGRGTKDGPFWNEAPDRLSDLLILAGLGIAAGRPDLGYLAGALAIFTAYLRELGHGIGLAHDFSGPLAKPQRMALVTVTAVVAALALLAGQGWPVLLVGLWAVLLGTGATILRRAIRMIAGLQAR